GLFGRGSAMFTFADVMHLFSDEFTGLCGCRLSLTSIFSGALDCRFLRHVCLLALRRCITESEADSGVGRRGSGGANSPRRHEDTKDPSANSFLFVPSCLRGAFGSYAGELQFRRLRRDRKVEHALAKRWK